MLLGKAHVKHWVLSFVLIWLLPQETLSCFKRGGSDDPCTIHQKQSGKVAHPDGPCPSKKYIKCENNQGKSQENCPREYFNSNEFQKQFNPKTEDCDWPWEVDCMTSTTTTITIMSTTTTTTSTTTTSSTVPFGCYRPQLIDNYTMVAGINGGALSNVQMPEGDVIRWVT